MHLRNCARLPYIARRGTTVNRSDLAVASWGLCDSGGWLGNSTGAVVGVGAAPRCNAPSSATANTTEFDVRDPTVIRTSVSPWTALLGTVAMTLVEVHAEVSAGSEPN
jgi:hypothetical protein